jgi:hypothetical protein
VHARAQQCCSKGASTLGMTTPSLMTVSTAMKKIHSARKHWLLSVIMLCVIVLRVIMLSVIMLSVIVLSVISHYAECH